MKEYLKIKWLIAFIVVFSFQLSSCDNHLKQRSNLEKSVVEFIVKTPSTEGGGTGFAISIKDKIFIVTNYHVVENAHEIEIVQHLTINGKASKTSYTDVEIVASDSHNDLAILYINDAPESAFVPLAINDFGGIDMNVKSVGFPTTYFSKDRYLGLVFRPSIENFGQIISEVPYEGNDLSGSQPEPTKFQNFSTRYVFNFNSVPGNSGGPLIDENNRVVGIIATGEVPTRMQDGAVPARYLSKLINHVITNIEFYGKVDSDLSLAKFTLENALSTYLSMPEILSRKSGDFYQYTENFYLFKILKTTIETYSLTPRKYQNVAFSNIFDIFSDGDAFMASRNISINNLVEKEGCFLNYNRVHSSIDFVLEHISLDQTINCIVDGILPKFSKDVIESIFYGKNNLNVLEIVPTDPM